MTIRKRAFFAAACCLPLLASGCVFNQENMLSWPDPEIPDLHPIREARSDEAVAEFDRRRNDAQYLAADASWRQGDYDRCREALEKILQRDPNHRSSLLLLADVHLETDHPIDAVDTLRRLNALDPQDAEAAYRLGVALEATGNTREAIPYLRQAVDCDPTNPKYAAALPEAEKQLDASQTVSVESAEDAEFAAALADWEAGRTDSAARRTAAFLKSHPYHIDANILQAEIDLAAKKPTDALQRMDRLAVRYPDNAQVCRATGLLFEAMGNTKAARHCFAEAQKLTDTSAVATVNYEEPVAAATDVAAPEPPTPAELAAAERREPSELDPAIAARWKNAIDGDNTDPQTALSAIVEALKMEQSDQAFEMSTRATTRFPQSAGLHRARGMAAYRVERYDVAEQALRKSLTLDRSQALSYFLLGSVLDRVGRNDEGERYRTEAARLDSRYAARR